MDLDDSDDTGHAESMDVSEATLDTIEAQLADVEHALARLEDGSYGQCEACGVAIDEEVLVRSPAARFCPDHLPGIVGSAPAAG